MPGLMRYTPNRLLVFAPVLLLTGCLNIFIDPARDVKVFDGSQQRSERAPATPPRAVANPSVQSEQRGPVPPFHVARSGDTVYSISRQYGVPIRSIIAVNDLRAPYFLIAGQNVKIPVPRLHTVKSGDTIYGISQQYDVGVKELVRLNGIQAPYRILVGQELTLPVPDEPARTAAVTTQPVRPFPQPAVSPPAAAPATGRPRPLPTKPSAQAPVETAAVPVYIPPPKRSGRFVLPVRGKIISSFGPKQRGLHNDGINIAAPRGAPVRAAENGIVVYSGNELAGFGNMVLLRHADGYMTAYGHNERLLVKKGQKISRGEVIGRVGSTGNVSTPQLHFEIRKGKNAVDPTRFLKGLS